MALTERNRNALYQGLLRTVEDEEAVEAMLSQFPARDQDEPATKDFVAAVEARLDQRMTIGFAEVDSRLTRLEATMDKRMTEGFAEVMDKVHREMRRWYLGSYGAMFALLAAVVTAAKILE